MTDDLIAQARRVLDLCRAGKLMVATAESCTGGLIAATLTEIAGSSDVVERGFVTYSNRAKTDLLRVPAEMIVRHGAVSEQVARAMAEGALARSQADLTVAVTGIAGPGGGSEEKPVGLVHLAASGRVIGTRHLQRRYGDIGRHGIRIATVADALTLLTELAEAAKA